MTLAEPARVRIMEDVRFDDDYIHIELTDGRVQSVGELWTG